MSLVFTAIRPLPFVYSGMLLASLPLADSANAQTAPVFDALGFSEGLAPLQIGGPFRSADACGDCHKPQYRAWSKSRHRQAHTNAIYQAGLIDEPSSFCVNCHAPLPEQAQEVMANLGWYASFDPRRNLPRPEKLPEPHAAEGITCVACHQRDGQILATTTGSGPHSFRAEPMLTNGQLCSGCHDFSMPEFIDGQTHLTDVPMQDTTAEWQAWGGDQGCVDCHMPAGSHRFKGANDRSFLASALGTDLSDDCQLSLWSIATGHDFPTGDLFRRISVETTDGQTWTEHASFGRVFAVKIDDQTGHVHKTLAANDAISPGEIKRVQLPATAVSYRVRFHYGAAHDEARGLVTDDQLYAVLDKGKLGRCR